MRDDFDAGGPLTWTLMAAWREPGPLGPFGDER